jgi:hypothetical protein
MSITDSYTVRPIEFEDCKEWCLYKHYAHRIPSISYAYGLYDKDNVLVGICTYGHPMSSPLKACLGEEWYDRMLELNRLCVNEGLPRNALSFFVTQTFKFLPQPCPLVSYADTEKSHHGYIYQATNWLYTGLSSKFEDYMVKGLESMHHTSIGDSVGRSDKGEYDKSKLERLKEKYGEENVYLKERSRKHRYFMFLGDKRAKRKMLRALPYDILPYPKGENQRYDASHQCATQGILF